MKRYSNNPEETFSQFNPEKYYAGKIENNVVDLQPIEHNSVFYQWNVCVSTNLNSYNGNNGLRKSEIFTFRNIVVFGDVGEFYEFDTAKEKYKWISDNL